MSKTALVDSVYETTKDKLTRREANEIIDAIFAVIGRAVKKDQKFTIPRFGTFVMRKRKARTGRNPRTGEKIQIQSSKTVNFRPSYAWKQALTGSGQGNPMQSERKARNAAPTGTGATDKKSRKNDGSSAAPSA